MIIQWREMFLFQDSSRFVSSAYLYCYLHLFVSIFASLIIRNRTNTTPVFQKRFISACHSLIRKFPLSFPLVIIFLPVNGINTTVTLRIFIRTNLAWLYVLTQMLKSGTDCCHCFIFLICWYVFQAKIQLSIKRAGTQWKIIPTITECP